LRTNTPLQKKVVQDDGMTVVDGRAEGKGAKRPLPDLRPQGGAPGAGGEIDREEGGETVEEVEVIEEEADGEEPEAIDAVVEDLAPAGADDVAEEPEEEAVAEAVEGDDGDGAFAMVIQSEATD
jgi:hypothetical protein